MRNNGWATVGSSSEGISLRNSLRNRNKPSRPPELPSNEQARPQEGSPHNATAPPSDRTAIYTLAGAGLLFAGSIFSATAAYLATNWSAKSTFDAAMVQIGVNILSADPTKSDVAPARKWAIDLVEKHAGQEFTAEDRGNLLHHPIQTQTFPSVAGSPFSGAPCSAFRRNPDGSWTIVKLDAGNAHFEDVTMKDTRETQLLDLFCGQH
jgi:hypothetical protein